MTLLAFGDSLTWGWNPADESRHPRSHRWGPVAAEALGWDLAEEGQNGRTTARDEWTGPADRNGARALPVMLQSHAPLRTVAIMLGTNDLILLPGTTAIMAGWGMLRLVQIVQGFPWPAGAAPGILLIAPPPLAACANPLPEPHSIAESHELAAVYADVAQQTGAAFLDAGRHVAVSPADGVHLEADATRLLGLAVADVLGR